ncbi:5-methyltetrahydropteroyltriglutamate--homocysteine S-methyltransferase [Xylella fastidiosa subsp. fastidiosa]|jgi:5-methyltetrahydropteroyltriglutamate--homocysteine methyltransferase|uniref:5-methyltetrahydropteroyltriglutamate--homocysteine methyltransferase n=2 Tax=Xylella fastidiosa TaxID=2371 RepID=METE_XYLFT|nr:5-methyltetrahydropteroyltriglutamate--homocysteine S-methyltransferase [Xylella fastidiosa]B2I621.1 RecName: Full=5-methyltetrahydropteroyltriglutamate--homocysteine methyltransferase; AltName: Full=Cobalamin-independent methionine synthase; AltName: Full=Methionine synthase, vitamin-B12 independent isozyme [Xylella fastidiosa M23]Q87BY8.1 RecName: Full=5-methyltetrahydropteroyltriglutamate--homocysteine methyltransferase; AltName: Full=Cobalamin-independent methionine synthase; AltName: Full
MTIVTNLGFPRIGARRELKRALESHWRGETDATQLQHTARELRARHWRLQRDAGVDLPPSNDFSLYDHVLDTAFLFDAIPQRYRGLVDADPLAGYFAMARGRQADNIDLHALEMTKWFDTNYHYLVPELHRDQHFALRGNKPIAEFEEALALGITTRPVLLGPVSFLLLSKTVDGSNRLDLLERLLPVYTQLLRQLQESGAEWVQIDEPTLVLDLDAQTQQAFRKAYAILNQGPRPKLLLTSYFGPLGDNLELALQLPADGLHIDLVRGTEQLDAVLNTLPAGRVLSAGLVNGRNIWRTDLDNALTMARYAQGHVGADRLWLAPSCSLLHVPVDLEQEKNLDADVRNWLAFAKQKLSELRVLADALDNKPEAETALTQTRQALEARRQSPKVHRPDVAQRLAALTPDTTRRNTAYPQRSQAQQHTLNLPAYPTTTIGSFPQTLEVREARAQFKSGKLSESDYEAFLKAETERCVRTQEEIGLDVLVHGEFERNDMVEYFGEQLDGFIFTKLGWVQSYGSRCVKPPIIYGDVVRPAPMTVTWSAYAQSLTDKPMKGMLTGPVTMLQWSFVRDDQERAQTCRQIALALRDEVQDLEKAGIKVIQIDEPAIREGLPLRRGEWADYLNWAVESFRIASSNVHDTTQIHTHMCYSEFNDIIEAVAALDADVISIETSRSRMELLDAFVKFRYPNAIGPGVYDIHSPRVPQEEEMVLLLKKARAVLPPEQLWVNPDCGLKTRGWKETRAALQTMVHAAQRLRAE